MKNKNKKKKQKQKSILPFDYATDDLIFLGILKKENLLVSSSSTATSPSTPSLILNIPLFCYWDRKDVAHLAAYGNPK